MKVPTMKISGFFQRSPITRTLWGFRREFLMVGIFSMIANLLMLTPTLYMLQVYDRVLASQSELTLIVMSLITLLLFGVMAFAEWMRSRVLVGAGIRLDEQLSTQVFNASFEAHLSQSGTDPKRAFGDLIQIRQFLTGNGIIAFFDAPWTPIYMAVLFLLHPLLGFLSIGFAIVQTALAWFGHRRALAPSEAAVKAGGDASAFLQGKLRNAEVLESMGMVNKLKVRWAQRHQLHLQAAGTSQQLTHRLTAFSKFIRYSQQSLGLGAGALLAIDGQITMGGMIAASVLMTRTLAPIDMLVGSWRQFLGVRFAFERLETMLLTHPETDPAFKRVAPSGAITLHQVIASAPGRSQPILKGINLSVRAGSVTAVLGPSGSGKSTLARAMMGIWPELSGDVLIDDLPLSGWNRTELGPYLGYLPQDIELFEGTIAENIARFGEINSNSVIAAAQAAGLHDMILRFPKGYDTPIGEAGGLLSGGQRQRIGLARAIYGEPRLIVLDEPNANLDDAGEAALFTTIKQLKAKGATVILITHRPGALAVADQLVVLHDGQVMAHGPRDAVLAALQAQRSAAAPGKPPVATLSAA